MTQSFSCPNCGVELRPAARFCDGFLLAFAAPRSALQCAVAIQRAFAAYSVEHPEQPIRVRIGLHTGEAIKEKDRFFGKTVILAARSAGQRGRDSRVVVGSTFASGTRGRRINLNELSR